MSLTLHITPTDQVDHELGTVECSDPELTPTRIRTVMRMRTRLLDGAYVVDPDVVAGAVAERLRPTGRAGWLYARAI